MRSYRFQQFLTLVLSAFVMFGFANTIHIQAEQIAYFPLDTDPCWTTEGQWEFGVPLGQGGELYGSPDPTSGATGSNVYGVNLAGDYSIETSGPYYLTTGPLDLSGYENTTLQFKRWLNTDYQPFVYATIEVSNNGTTWVQVWNNGGMGDITDYQWTPVEYDISSVADNSATVYIRWGYEIGIDYGPWEYSGWNIDDVALSGMPLDDLAVAPSDGLYSSGYEGGPFIPSGKNYLLGNTGPNSLDWTAAEVNDMPWLDIEPNSGTLEPGHSTNVSVSINANADGLPIGTYGTDLRFTNLSSGINRVRPVTLAVKDIPPDGFGANATGGAGGPVVTVNNAIDLKTYVEANEPYIVQVEGTVDMASVPNGTVSIRSNKTIKGIGTRPTIIGSLLFVPDSNNIIIRGLNITNPHGRGDGDGMTVMWRITNLFITHCTVYDCTDGCIDITRASDNVTVSWCKFYYTDPNAAHRFVNLIGGDDGHLEDRGKLHITFHHNWWSTLCHERMPRVRFGRVHIYNNYYSCTGNYYCAGAALESHLLVENNYFNNVRNPIIYYITDPNQIQGKINARGNIFYGFTWANWDDGGVFTPPYPYGLDNAADVPAIVMAGAGAPVCYGDLDHSKSVDFNDLLSLANYWLDTNGIVDLDYNDDGIINSYEFALLAKNWRQPDFAIPATPTGLAATGGDSMVSLNWDDNTESDLAGYNIYRSETNGSGYTRLNVSLVSSSDYIDNTAINGTLYYYVVTAVSTFSIESAYSYQASATPLSSSSIIIQENTAGFCGTNGIISTLYAGYTGTGYCYAPYAIGKYIDWSISVPASGTYTITWRYAVVASNRPAKLLVNSVEVVPSISFPSTGTWTNWSDGVLVETSLTADINNIIHLEAITSDGLANIDYIMVTGNSPQPASCPE